MATQDVHLEVLNDIVPQASSILSESNSALPEGVQSSTASTIPQDDYEVNDIWMEYHLASGKSINIKHFGDYRCDKISGSAEPFFDKP